MGCCLLRLAVVRRADAVKALKRLQGMVLDEHELSLKMSNKTGKAQTAKEKKVRLLLNTDQSRGLSLWETGQKNQGKIKQAACSQRGL